MSHDINNLQNNINNQDVLSDDNQILKKDNSIFLKKLFKFALISCGILAIIVTILYINRAPITKNVLSSYFKSKNVQSEIDIKKINPSGIEFNSIKLGEKNHETIIINNGSIDWRFGLFQDFIIKNINADNITFNASFNKNGLDFGAIKPLLGGKSNGKPINIKNINIKTANLNLATEYGLISTNLRINGNLEKGFKANGVFNSPNNIVANGQNIPISIATSELIKNKPMAFGLSTNVSNLSLLPNDIIKGLYLEGLSGFINLGLGINEDKTAISIIDTNGKLDSFIINNNRINNNSFAIKNANIAFKTGLKDIILDFKNANLVAKSFASKAIKTGEINIHLNNNDNKLLLAAANTSGLVNANAIYIDTALPNILNLDNFNQEIGIIIKGLNPNILGSNLNVVNNSLNSFGLSKLEAMSINTKINTVFDGKDLNFGIKNTILGISNHQNIVFKPKEDFINTNGFWLKDIKTKPEFGGNLSGDILVSDDNAKIITRLNGLNIDNNGVLIDIDSANLSGLKFKEVFINGNLGKSQIISKNGEIIGKIACNFKLNNLNSPTSNLNLNVDFKGKEVNYSLAGDLSNLAILGNKLKSGSIDANGFASLSDKNGKLNLNIKNGSFDAFKSNLSGLNGSAVLEYSLQNNLNINGDISASLAQFKMNEIYANNAAISGPISININKNIEINGNKCLNLSASKLIVSNQEINMLNGALCPSNNRFAIIGDKAQIFASTDLKPLSINMGSAANRQTLMLSDLIGQFSSDKSGNIIYDSGASDFAYKFKYSETDWATANAKNAGLHFVFGKSQNILNVDIKGATIDGLPIYAGGDIKGQVLMKTDGLGASLAFNNLKIKDREELPRFGEFVINGTGKLANNVFNITGDITNKERGIDFAKLAMYHNLARGFGAVNIKADKLKFTSERVNGKKIGLDLVDLLPPLTGLINESNGIVDASANIAWANDKISSSAIISTDDFDFSAGPGPVDDISGTIKISDLFNLKSDGIQYLKVGSFNPGVPIEKGEVAFTLNGDNSINLVSAAWPFAEGVLSIVPTKITFDNKDKDLAVKVDRINITQLLRLTKVPNLEIEGIMSGILPIKLQENNVIISGGRLLSDGEGVLKYTGPDLTAKTPKAKGFAKLKERLFGKPPPPIAELAVDALRNLKYKILELGIDGRLTGDMIFKVLLEGANQSVLSGQPFKFNIKASMPVGDIVNSFKNLSNPNQFQTFDENGNIVFNPELLGKPN